MNPAIQHLQQQLERTPASPQRADLLYELAMEQRNLDTAVALRTSEQALTLSRELGYRRGEAYALRALGSCHYIQADYPQALITTLEALKLFEELDDQPGLFRALNTLSNIYYRLDDYVISQDYNFRVLKIANELGDRTAEASTFNNIGLVYLSLEDFPNALEHFQRSLAIYQELDSREYAANPQMNIGIVQKRQQRYPESIDSYRQALQLYRDTGDRQGECLCLNNLGGVHSAAGQNAVALDLYRTGLALAQQVGNRYAEAETRFNLGELLVELQDYAAAESHLTQGLSLSEQLGSKDLQFKVLASFSRVYRQTGRMEEALDSFRRSHEIEDGVLSQQVEEKVKAMQVVHDVERTKKEAELYRLKNIELAKAYDELSHLADSYERLSRANQELLQLDKLKSEFMANVSHELRSPLTAASGYIDHLDAGRAGPLNATQATLLERVKTNLKRLTRQISDLLDFTVIEAGQFTIERSDFDLRGLAEETGANHLPEMEKKGLSLGASVPAGLRVLADRERIGQVLDNLIINAMKFTTQGGVTIAAAAVDGGRIRIRVSDTGIGMPPESLPRIFERFQQLDGSTTRRYGGVGLGLAIVKSIIEAHDSTIEVESRQGQGTTFTFHLAAAPPTAG